MADVKPILSNFYLDRCYCQELWQILLPSFWADVIALLFEVVIPHFLADVGPILLNVSWLRLLPRFMAGLIAKIIMGRCCCPIVSVVDNTL